MPTHLGRVTLALILVSSLAHAQAAKRMLLPGFSSTMTNTPVGMLANELFCGVAPAPYDITPTKMAAYLGASHSTSTCSFGIYEDTDDTGSSHLLFSVTGNCASGVHSLGSQTPHALTGGTRYRMCVCSSVDNHAAYAAVTQAVTCCQEFNVTQLLNSFRTTTGRAAQPCTAGALPTATGALTVDNPSPGRNALRFPQFMVEE